MPGTFLKITNFSNFRMIKYVIFLVIVLQIIFVLIYTLFVQMKIKKEVGFYEVKELLDLKTINSQEYCLVWWVNFPRNQATWERIENLIFMPGWEVQYQELKDKLKAKKQQEAKNEGIHRKSQIKQIKRKNQTQRNSTWKQSQCVLQRRKNINMNGNGIENVQTSTKNQQQRHGLKQLSEPLQIAEISSSQNEQQISQSIQSKQYHQRSQRHQAQKPQIKRRRVNLPQYKNEQLKSNDFTKKIHKADLKAVKFKGKKTLLRPLSIDLQVTQPKNIPFEGLELERIKASFMRQDKILYQVQFKDDPVKEGIILNEKYLKLLWPRKLAQFMLTKIKHKQQ